MTTASTGSSAALPIGTSWWQLIEARSAATPDRRFLIDANGRSLTFDQYRTRAEEVAAGLFDLGIRPGQVVSWQLPTTIDSAVLMAALCRLDTAQNPIIPILRRTEVAQITGQVGSHWLVVPRIHRGFDFAAMAAEVATGGNTTVLVIDNDLPGGDPANLAAPNVPIDDRAQEVRWYFFSSGTTSTPKGAKHTDASVMASSNAQISYIGLRDDDLFPVPFPLTHIGGIMLLTAYLRTGASLLLIESFDPATSPQVMAQHGATLLGSATPFFHAYLAAQKAHGGERLFPALRQLQAGGAPIAPELNAECVRVFGTPIYNQWGLTEFPAATSLGVEDPPHEFEGSVGRMAPGAEISVRNFDSALSLGIQVSTGVEGELWVRGPQRFLGYVDASLDADALDAEGFFRTGDLGHVDSEGFVWITGRLKDIIIRNAENLSAQEIENVLLAHIAIADVAVIGLPDTRTGERACAVVVLRPGVETLTLADLVAHCRAAGLAVQKAPEQIEIVEALPRNLMGKVLKQDLRAALTQR
ncbi:MAG: hypothetical protein RLZZ623_3581 [Actinomycetota bacterium]